MKFIGITKKNIFITQNLSLFSKILSNYFQLKHLLKSLIQHISILAFVIDLGFFRVFCAYLAGFERDSGSVELRLCVEDIYK